MTLASLRKNYQRGALNEAELAPDPLVQFDQWWQEVLQAKITEPNAMSLATVGPNGHPAARIVLLKNYEVREIAPGASGRGFVWFTNYQSRKGEELQVQAYAALLFYWVELERQVRIEGRVEKTSAIESDSYFMSRPESSRIGAWASPQSQVIPDRQFLEQRETQYRQRYGDQAPRPAHWGGYRLIPDRMEFWQGRPSRLHDRLVYRRRDEWHWDITRLAP